LRTHFRPFTEVMRKSRREVMRKIGWEPRTARGLAGLGTQRLMSRWCGTGRI